MHLPTLQAHGVFAGNGKIVRQEHKVFALTFAFFAIIIKNLVKSKTQASSYKFNDHKLKNSL